LHLTAGPWREGSFCDYYGHGRAAY
jgi:hypothetical protein